VRLLGSDLISSLPAVWMPPTNLTFANGPWQQFRAMPVLDCRAMNQTITAELGEHYSLCPRKAFLIMSGVANAGTQEYVWIIDEQAAANRQVHRASFGQALASAPGGVADLSTGPQVIADAELTTDGLHACCHFLTKVQESSRLGRFCYEPVKVIGTCRASRPDALGLAYQAPAAPAALSGKIVATVPSGR